MNGSSSNQVNGTSGLQTTIDQNTLSQLVGQNEANMESTFNANSKKPTGNFTDFPKQINEGRQGKHIPDHNNYHPGKSTLNLSMQEAQSLVNEYSGKGEKVSDNKERVDFGKTIGNYVDPETGESRPTTIGMIHYSKNGTHIVPVRPKYYKKKDEGNKDEH